MKGSSTYQPRPQHWAESAKVSILGKRISELEEELASQAQRIKAMSLEKTRYTIEELSWILSLLTWTVCRLEDMVSELTEENSNGKKELLIVREQLQAKSVKSAALEAGKRKENRMRFVSMISS